MTALNIERQSSEEVKGDASIGTVLGLGTASVIDILEAIKPGDVLSEEQERLIADALSGIRI